MYSDQQLLTLFQQSFNLNDYTDFVRDVLKPDHWRVTPEQLSLSANEGKGYFLGTKTTSDHYEIGFYYFRLHSSVAKRRVGLRQLVKNYLNFTDAALVVFDDGNNWRLSLICDLKDEATAPKRFTFVFGDAACGYHTPISRFIALQQSGVTFKALREAFSVEALTKEFYGKLYNWYLWARDNRTGVTFPNDPVTDNDDREKIDIKIIRLITRMLFVWFIKQKHLVPDNLFEIDYLKTILKDFDPQSSKQGNYYNAILQNLFFATLNQECDKRAFIENTHFYGRGRRSSESYGVKNLYRDNTKESWFTFSEDKKEEEVICLFSSVPYLNGGLFECLDKYDLDENETKYKPITYYDGFSSNDARSNNRKNLKYRAFIPNELFFLQSPKKVMVTIKAADGDKQEETDEVTVIGLIELFKQYNFTVEENSTTDTEVSLDPELLGRVFENLLAAYNPETQESARKSTGSYYTPREIVDYMVDESLKAYLTGECGNDKAEIDSLFATGKVSSSAVAEKIDHDLRIVKVLDPACGSGAFPMGILLRMTDLIEHLEGEGFNRYETKLQIIKDCIYGIDIQPIAMLICKLRFFISLICDSDYNPYDSNNFGIIPLPSLETKFVAANSLLPAKVKEFDNTLMQEPELQKMKEELLALRKSILQQHTTSDKMENRRKDRALCKRMQQYIIDNAGKPNEDVIRRCEESIRNCEVELPKYAGERLQKVVEYDLFGTEKVTYTDRNKCERERLSDTIRTAKARIETEQNKVVSDKFMQAVKDVTDWDPYNQNHSNGFFDAEWMFGIGINGSAKQGFDIVIGNPPYGADIDNLVEIYGKEYPDTSHGFKDIYKYFIDKGIRLLNKSGLLAYITPSTFIRQPRYCDVRRLMLKYKIEQIIDLGENVFDAVVPVAISLTIKGNASIVKLAELTKDQDLHSAFRNISFSFIEQSVFNETINNIFVKPVRLGDKTKLLNDIISMKDAGINYQRVNVGLSQKTKSDLAKRLLYFGKKENSSDIEYWKDEDINSYYSSPHTNRFCRTNIEIKPNEHVTLNKRYFEIAPKLIWRQTAPYCICTIDYDGVWFGRSIQGGIINDNYKGIVSYEYMCALLNSKYLRYLYAMNVKETGRVFPQVKLEKLKPLPIVIAKQEEQKQIQEIVLNILAKKKANPQADTTVEENTIDKLVYQLYGLTEQEIQIVEGK
mgnify:CR=1 FL=1